MRFSTLLTAFLLLLVCSASTQTTFTGAVSNLWTDAANWSNGLPGPGNDATIPVGLTVDLVADYVDTWDFNTTVDGTMKFGNVLPFTSVSVTLQGDLTVNGTLDFAGGTFLTVEAGNTVTNAGVVTNTWIMNNYGTIVNSGTWSVNEFGSIWNFTGFSFTNYGSLNSAGNINLDGLGTFSNESGATATFQNFVSVGGSSLFENNGGDVEIQGTCNVINGSYENNAGTTTVTLSGSLTVSGGTSFTNGGFMVVYGSMSNFNDATNTGTITVESGATFTNWFTLVNNGALINNGTLTVDPQFQPAVIQNKGTITNAGTFTNDGTVNNICEGIVLGTQPTPNPAVDLATGPCGCTDVASCNYDSAAVEDDLTCDGGAIGCDVCSGQTDGTGTILDNPEVGQACDDGGPNTIQDSI